MPIRKAVILAAGKGTRFFSFSKTLPKEMAVVGGKPIIEHTVKLLQVCGISDILIILNPKKKAILSDVRSTQWKGIRISYQFQKNPNGTAKAVNLARSYVGKESFVVIYGDNYIESKNSISEIMAFHVKNNVDATLLLQYSKEFEGLGLVKIDELGKILKIAEKPTRIEASSLKRGNEYLCVAGLHVLKPDIFGFIDRTKPGSNGETWLTDSVELMRESGHNVMGIVSKTRVLDIGTGEKLQEARALVNKIPLRTIEKCAL